MPIVDLVPMEPGARIDTPKGFAVTPGEDDINHGSDAPALGSVIGAAFRQDNLITNLVNSEAINDQPDGTNVWDEIKGSKYEPLWDSFVDVRNKPALEARKRKIDQEEDDRKTLSAAPWYQAMPAQLAAGVLDPTILMPRAGSRLPGRRQALALRPVRLPPCKKPAFSRCRKPARCPKARSMSERRFCWAACSVRPVRGF
jgi:hypothetical protein